jgi:hypothetical protein
MSNWQPIETAPKDGTTIVGWSKENGADILFYGMTEHDDVIEEGWLYHFDFQTWPTKPTHWMPLPKPPTV